VCGPVLPPTNLMTVTRIRQGDALSPFLSNVYLDRCLDRSWRQQNPRMPLLRVVDDLLVLIRDERESAAAQTSLRSMLVAAGMQANASKGVVRDLVAGHSIDWLGYTIRKGGQGVDHNCPSGAGNG
jgi:hypothetical protein